MDDRISDVGASKQTLMTKDYRYIVFDDLSIIARRIINETLTREGGTFTTHKHDWPTKWGIRQLSADRAGYKGRIEDLDRDTAARIWAALFWYGPNLHRLAEVSPLITQHLLDTSGPAGLSVGIRHLQQVLTSVNAIVDGEPIYGEDLEHDGKIGPKTLAHLAAYLDHRKSSKGDRALAMALNCLQAAHFIDVANRLPEKRSFGFGWLNERVIPDLVALSLESDTMLA